jgi:CRISPR-associated protein Csx14
MDDLHSRFTADLSTPAFVATLGLQPQIITRALDKLLRIEPGIARGTIIHTSTYRDHPNWPTLTDFKIYLDAHYPNIQWDWIPIERPGLPPLDDVDSPLGAEVAFQVIYNVTRELKRLDHHLHCLIAGGRKSIIIYSVLSAQLLFDSHDKLWHVFSDDEHSRELALRPHVADAIVQLVEIPVLYVSRVAPMVRELILHSDDPSRAIRFYQEHEDVETLIRMQRFFDQCDPIDQQIILLRFQGQPNLTVAEKVHLSDSAVTNRLKSVAERFYSDPLLGGGRYNQLPDKPHRTLLFHLSPLLRRMSNTGP